MKKIQTLRFLPPSCLSLLLAALALPAVLPSAIQAQTQTLEVDPAATNILHRMTAYLGGLPAFSVKTHNTLQDQLESGQKIDMDVTARATVRRPNRLRAERRGDVIDQSFYYDGKTLTLQNPSAKVFATVPAPATIEGTLDYARDTLALILPASDLIYTNAYALLMKDVNLAANLGKAVIDGVKCDHLLFSRPGVDFQLWVADSGHPLPHKYVVTDTTLTNQLSFTTVMSDWEVAPKAGDSEFTFKAPKDATPITFLPLVITGGSAR